MNYKIELGENFKKEAKRLIKKFPSLRSEIAEFGKVLSEDPTMGKHLGNNVYKIRLSITSKGRGKSGGARIITYVKIINQTVYLLIIYDKGDRDSITDKEIQELLKEYI